MAVIFIESIRRAFEQGTLIDLVADYRTSRTIRACLPRRDSYSFAMSAAAYRQEIESGTARDRQTRMEIIGAFLTKVLERTNKPTPLDLELTFPGEVGTSCSLKLQWFAPSEYWVVLLPQDQLQPNLALA